MLHPFRTLGMDGGLEIMYGGTMWPSARDDAQFRPDDDCWEMDYAHSTYYNDNGEARDVCGWWTARDRNAADDAR